MANLPWEQWARFPQQFFSSALPWERMALLFLLSGSFPDTEHWLQTLAVVSPLHLESPCSPSGGQDLQIFRVLQKCHSLEYLFLISLKLLWFVCFIMLMLTPKRHKHSIKYSSWMIKQVGYSGIITYLMERPCATICT